jgi:hypothetical protein
MKNKTTTISEALNHKSVDITRREFLKIKKKEPDNKTKERLRTELKLHYLIKCEDLVEDMIADAKKIGWRVYKKDALSLIKTWVQISLDDNSSL